MKYYAKQYENDRYLVLIVGNNKDILIDSVSELQNEFTVYYTRSVDEALEKIGTVIQPDVIISEITLPTMHGFEFYDILMKTSRHHSIPFIFMSGNPSPDERREALNKGAVEYFEMPQRLPEISVKINTIVNILMSRELDVIENYTKNTKRKVKEQCKSLRITPSEQRVVEYIMEGKQNKEIASYLNMTMGTVKVYVNRIFRKCNVQNRVELVNTFIY